MGYNVVILVGGETTGTRFRPLSINSPKLLFAIAGRPLIEHIIDSLISQVKEIDNVFLLGFYKDSSKFVQFTKDMENKLPHIGFEYLSEANSKGTAGGLYYFQDKLFQGKGIVFIHGDIICDYPFKKLVDFHEKHTSNVTILGINPLTIVENFKKYLSVKADDSDQLVGDNINNKFGTIVSPKSSVNVEHYVEKPSKDFTIQFNTKFDILINGGIYILDKKIFEVLKGRREEISLEWDILRNLPDSDLKFNVFKDNVFWYNLKTPLSALLANGFFLKQQNAVYDNENIGPNVSIGKNVIIGKGTRIKNAIIGDNVVIGDNSFINNAIISNNVKIGKWGRIEGTITNATICRDVIHTNSDGNIRLINNIVVLCENISVLQDIFVFNSIVLPHKELKFDTKYEIVM
ncbi:mannose-1-phosphate guanyltransferase [[Candida] jaroonii]|uniref:Mannose-1-phosphate guanyltransferase n=1 Tax=[Candida] jaroonii TaxID=467808 RepID=A0ACA9Y327_9ASCO|nr:mannose-1-phosphate guanyltransferase [[Candida] jaroonii]